MAAKPSLDSDDDDFSAISSQQLRDFMDVLSMESDLDLAYNLQLEEALVASLASSSSSSSIHRPEVQNFEHVDRPRIGTLHSRDVEECDRIFQDWLQTEFDMRRTGGERHRQVHNHGCARGILNIRDDDWRDQSENSRKPFGEGCSNGVDDQGVFKLYFKGLVGEEEIGNEKRVVAGIGVAICNPEDKLVVEVKRRLPGNERSKIVAELKALIAGFNVALDLKLKRLCFYSDYYPLFQFVRLLSALVHCLILNKFLAITCLSMNCSQYNSVFKYFSCLLHRSRDIYMLVYYYICITWHGTLVYYFNNSLISCAHTTRWRTLTA